MGQCCESESSVKKGSPPSSPLSTRSTQITGTSSPESAVTTPAKRYEKPKIIYVTPPAQSARKPPPRNPQRSVNVSATRRELDRSPTMNRKFERENNIPATLKKLETDDWEKKVEGINVIQNFAQHKPSELGPYQHDVVVALLAEAKNLRSSVSKQAISCLGFMFTGLQRNMDPETEKVGQVLVAKSGDASNAFIREDAEKALEAMVDNVSYQKSLNVLTTFGISSKNAVIRTSSSSLLYRLVELASPAKLLSNREMSDKIITTAAHMTTDGQPAPRYHGKAILATLQNDERFERALSSVPAPVQSKVRMVLDSVESKGLGNVPNGTVKKAKFEEQRTQGELSRRNSSRRQFRKVPNNIQDDIDSAVSNLCSNMWETRLNGLNEFEALVRSHPATVLRHPKLIDEYSARLNDINSKVALYTLEGLPTVVKALAPFLNTESKSFYASIIQNLVAQLPSKNDDIRALAQNGLDALIENGAACASKVHHMFDPSGFMAVLDHSCLITHFAQAIRTGNVRQKPDLLLRLSEMCEQSHAKMPKSITMHAVPALADQLKMQIGDSALRKAVNDFAMTLSRIMGKQQLIDQLNKQIKGPELSRIKSVLQ